MFADDTNLLFEHTDLRILFSMVNDEQNKIYEWFKANKLSLNAGKTKYSLFHEVLLDEHLSWKKHIKYTENQIAKSMVYCIEISHF